MPLFVQKLYSTSRYGNMNSDFIMIIAALVKAKVEEEVVEKGSDTEK